MQNFELVVERDQTTNATTDIHTNIIGVLRSDPQTRVQQSLLASHDGKLLKGVVAAGFFSIPIGRKIEGSNLTCEMDTKATGIVAPNFVHATFSLANRLPPFG